MWSDFQPQCFYSLALQSCFLSKNENMKGGEKTQQGSTHSITIWCSILCMNNLLFKNCLKLVYHSNLFIALHDINSQHGSARSITMWCSILCMNNRLFKNCLKHLPHSDLFIALFDLNSLSLHFACQNWVYNNCKRCENVNSKWFPICFPEETIK